MSIPIIDVNKIREKTINELRQTIFINKKQLEQLHSKKIALKKQKEKNSVKTPTELIFNKIFQFVSNKEESTQSEIDQCTWDEKTIEDNLELLEKEMRMKELAKVHEWWLSHEEYIAKRVKPDQLKAFKNAAFQVLLQAIDRDESTFIEVADKILLDLQIKESINY